MNHLKSRGERIFDVFNFIFLGLFAFICLYPFLNILALSFNTGADSARGGVTIWPREFTLANYAIVFRMSTVVGAYRVTIARTVVGTISSLFITALAAYGLSEHGLPGKKPIMTFILITMLFNGGLIPTFLVYRGVGLINTFGVFIIPAMFSAWNCFIMKTMFQGIPVSLKESIRIDGGNEFTILRHIVLPVSLPTFAALGLFTAVGHWNDWFAGMYFVKKNSLIPVQTYLMMIMNSMMEGSRNLAENMAVNMPADVAGGYLKMTSMSLKMSVLIIGTAPILIVYPFLQRYFVKGVLIGSVKE